MQRGEGKRTYSRKIEQTYSNIAILFLTIYPIEIFFANAQEKEQVTVFDFSIMLRLTS